MRSYNHLWERFLCDDNVYNSMLNAAVGKKKRHEVRRLISNPDKLMRQSREYAANFHNCSHHEMIIRDGNSGKERIIIVPRFKEHIIHHMVVNAMMPIFTTGMYIHTYSSIPGRGLHMCMKRIREWIDEDPKNVKYCLKLDIKKFFNSIDHDILRNKIHATVHDYRFLRVVDEIIEATDRGIPLGFYTSHWFANWLLQPLDHYIKEQLHVKHYARYMDDMVLFGSNKERLHEVKFLIEEYLAVNLHLRLKENWQLFRFDHFNKHGERKGRALDFIGFKFYRDKTTLRKSIMLRLTRKARKIQKKGKCTIHDAHQLMSYLGWVEWADAYYVYKHYVAPVMTRHECKDYISQYDKRHARLLKDVDSVCVSEY